LSDRRHLPRAAVAWALDSGGFTELSRSGSWQITAVQYVAEVRRYQEEIGRLEWAASMDWMCEPAVREQTGLTVSEHQRRSTAAYRRLVDLAPDLPWLPVLQGWERDDYLRHRDQYLAAGVELSGRLFGVGSICRRQGTRAVIDILAALFPLALHGFGVKISGLRQAAVLLTSADSMAWSATARYRSPLPGCSHRNCANCRQFALAWHGRVERIISNSLPVQFSLPL
jgi:hypothetical protein